MSFDQKLDFSWHMKILGHFQNLANLGNFSNFFGNIFLYAKNRHTYRFLWKKLQKWVCYLIKSKEIVCGQPLWRWLYIQETATAVVCWGGKSNSQGWVFTTRIIAWTLLNLYVWSLSRRRNRSKFAVGSTGWKNSRKLKVHQNFGNLYLCSHNLELLMPLFRLDYDIKI